MRHQVLSWGLVSRTLGWGEGEETVLASRRATNDSASHDKNHTRKPLSLFWAFCFLNEIIITRNFWGDFNIIFDPKKVDARRFTHEEYGERTVKCNQGSRLITNKLIHKSKNAEDYCLYFEGCRKLWKNFILPLLIITDEAFNKTKLTFSTILRSFSCTRRAFLWSVLINDLEFSSFLPFDRSIPFHSDCWRILKPVAHRIGIFLVTFSPNVWKDPMI